MFFFFYIITNKYEYDYLLTFVYFYQCINVQYIVYFILFFCFDCMIIRLSNRMKKLNLMFPSLMIIKKADINKHENDIIINH